jgi:hypothetical protein
MSKKLQTVLITDINFFKGNESKCANIFKREILNGKKELLIIAKDNIKLFLGSKISVIFVFISLLEKINFFAKTFIFI